MESPWEKQPGVGRAEDLVSWSWSAVDRTLADDVTDPQACLPFVHPDTTTFYWELHFQARRLTRVDFLHRPALLRPAGEAVTPDPIVGRLVSWYEANAVVRRNCHRSVWLELDGPIDKADARRLHRVVSASASIPALAAAAPATTRIRRQPP